MQTANLKTGPIEARSFTPIKNSKTWGEWLGK